MNVRDTSATAEDGFLAGCDGALLRAVIEALPGAFVIATLDGRILHASAAFLAGFALDAGGTAPSTVADIFDPADAGAGAAAFARLAAAAPVAEAPGPQGRGPDRPGPEGYSGEHLCRPAKGWTAPPGAGPAAPAGRPDGSPRATPGARPGAKSGARPGAAAVPVPVPVTVPGAGSGPIRASVIARLLRDAQGRPSFALLTLQPLMEAPAGAAARDPEEDRWRMAAEIARMAVWDHDATTGRTFHSPMWRDLRGIPASEPTDDSREGWLAGIHPEDIDRVLAQVDRQEQGEPGFEAFEYRQRHRDGHYVWLRSLGRPVARDAAGRTLRIIGTDSDVTERRELEAALAAERERARAFLAAVADAAICVDACKRVVMMNKVAEDWTGWTMAEAEGRPLDEILNLDPEAPLVALVGACIGEVERQSLGGDARLGSRSGALREIEATAVPLCAAPQPGGGAPKDSAPLPGGAASKDAARLPGGGAPEDAAPQKGRGAPEEAAPRGGAGPRTGRDAAPPAGPGAVPAAAAGAAGGAATGAVLVMKDMTVSRLLVRQLSHEASHDLLTGLLNRPSFEGALDAAQASCEHEGTHAILFLDLIEFKSVNDRLGRAAGDRFLVRVANTIRSCVRRGDICARYGGDEFAVLLHGCGPEGAHGLRSEMARTIGALEVPGRNEGIGVAIGVGLIDAATGAEAALAAAIGAARDAKGPRRKRG